MTEHDDLDMLVAEFVLGTLPARERDYVETQRRDDPQLETLIRQWEERLAGLGDDTKPVEPSPALFASIEKALDHLEASSAKPSSASVSSNGSNSSSPSGASNDTSAHGATNVVALRSQLNRWRWSTAITSAAALVLVSILVLQPNPATTPQSFVAVFQHNDEQPAFLLTVDLEGRQLNIKPVTAEAKPGKSYQLWIKADELGPNPRSVGVLSSDFKLDGPALSAYDPDLLKKATFGISVEPEGGSPTGQPTSSAIHGFLYPTGEND